MRVLGLLQNSWANDPERVEMVMMRFGRRVIITRLLIKSKSGQVLRKCLPDWFWRIEYENSSPRVLAYASAYGTVNMTHVKQVVANVKPNVIIAFGNVAESAVKQLHWDNGPILVTQFVPERLRDVNTFLNEMHELWP